MVFETMRSLGWETMTTRILMELFLPFILYLGAEAVHVSGILSVVAAGLLIRFDRTGIGRMWHVRISSHPAYGGCCRSR